MSSRIVRLGDFLIRSKIPVDIEDNKQYKRVTIRTKHQGVSIRDFEIGSKIGTKKQFILKSGQFVLSKIDAMYGAFGVAPDEVDGAIITGNFWAYDYDKEMVSIEWLNHFTNSPDFYDLCRRASTGITHRKYLDEEFFLGYEVNLPDLKEQELLVASIDSIRDKINSFEVELSHQLTLLSNLNQAILQEAVQGKLLISSPPLKEEYPQGEVVKNTNLHPQGEVVKNTTIHPQGEVVGNTTTHPQGEVAKNLNNLPHLKTFRKKLRNNLTPAEAKLWTLLKGKQLENKKFRRQFSVANYILDFYCPAEHLAIELDGQGHFEASQAEYDYERDLFLNYCGIKVLRFENKWVWNNPEGMLEEIKQNFGWKDRYDPSVLRTAPLKGEQLESGSELLKRIKAEKMNKHAVSTRAKKEKPLPPIKPEEIPFEIPENWVWCRLGEICEIKGGKRVANGYKLLKTPTPHIYIRVTDMKNGTISEDDIHYLDEKMYQKIKQYTIGKDDLYMTIVGATIGKCGLVPDKFHNMNLTENAAKISPVLVDKKFLLTCLQSKFCQDQFIDKTKQVAVQKMALNRFSVSIIPLPPLSEQKRIVAAIEKQFALTQQLKEKVLANQQATEQLLKALLHQAFEIQEPIELIKN